MRKAKEGGIGLNYLIKTLHILKTELSASDLWRQSPFRHKGSHQALIRSLLKSHYIIRRSEKRHFRNKTPNVFYSLTFDGERFLEFLERLDA